MNHTQLKAFDAVVREGSFSRAGIRLGLTQPAITIQVKALERYYGKKLFNRRGRGVTPTTTGQSLYEMTQRLFKIEEQAHHLLKNPTDEKSAGDLKVGSDCQGLASWPGYRVGASAPRCFRNIPSLFAGYGVPGIIVG
jgi:DNA-binding transcriptional LysR family regulator